MAAGGAKMLPARKIGCSCIRHLLHEAIKGEKVKHAIDEYKVGKISFGKASELAGLTLWEFIDEVRRRNVQLHLSIQDAEDEINRIKDGKIDRFLPRSRRK